MKIKRYQAGGIVYTPFIPNTGGGEVQSDTRRESSPKEPKKDRTFTSAIIKTLEENGLDNDVSAFLAHSSKYLNRSSMLSTSSLFGGENTEDDYDVKDYIQVLSMANRVRNNKVAYDDAMKSLSASNAWSEVAMDDRGRMYVWTKDKQLDLVNPYEYSENKENYTALTNSEVLQLRKDNPELAFNTSLLTNVGQSIGTDQVVKYMKEVIGAFGTSSVEGYTVKDKEKLLNEFSILMNGGPEGVYKYKSEQKGTQNALNYLYNSLTPQMKNMLVAKTAAEGLDPNKIENVTKLLVMALNEHRSSKISVDYEEKMSADLNPESSGKKSDMVDKTPAELFVTGQGTPKSVSFNIGDDNTLTFNGIGFTNVTDNKDKSIGTTNIQTFLDTASIAGAMDRSKVFAGEKQVALGEYHKIMYEGTEVYKVNVPIKHNDKGVIVPDLEQNEKNKAFFNWYDKNKDESPLIINKKLQEFGVEGITYNKTSNGTYALQYAPGKYKAYAVMSGYVDTGDTIGDDGKKLGDLKYGVSGQKDKKDLYVNITTWDTTAEGTKKTYKYQTGKMDPSGWFWKDGASITKAPIFIELNEPADVSIQTGGQVMDYHNRMYQAQQQEFLERQRRVAANSNFK